MSTVPFPGVAATPPLPAGSAAGLPDSLTSNWTPPAASAPALTPTPAPAPATPDFFSGLRHVPVKAGPAPVPTPDDHLSSVLADNPGFQKVFNSQNTKVVFPDAGRMAALKKDSGLDRSLEYWSPEEHGSSTFPRPAGQDGKHVLEIYSPNLQRNPDDLKSAIYGDLLHGMVKDPTYAALREQFKANYTPATAAFNAKFIKDGRGTPDEVDDMYIRGRLAANQGAEWQSPGRYSAKQEQILQTMKQYLAAPSVQPSKLPAVDPNPGLFSGLRHRVVGALNQVSDAVSSVVPLTKNISDVGDNTRFGKASNNTLKGMASDTIKNPVGLYGTEAEFGAEGFPEAAGAVKETAGGVKDLFQGLRHKEVPAPELSEDESRAKVAEIRAGDARSKNKGVISVENPTGKLVQTNLPISSFSPEQLDHLRESTDPARVADYAQQKIDTPIYATPGKKGENVGKFIVSDGGHRLLAAVNRGDKTIPALIPAPSTEAATTEWAPPAGMEKGIPRDEAVSTNIPLSKISISENAYNDTLSNISRGRASQSDGPISIFHNSDNGQYLVEDGMHRLVQAHQNGETSVPAKIWSGYSDTVANVRSEDKMDLSPEPSGWAVQAEQTAKKNGGGFTIHPSTGEVPKTGFQVEVLPEARKVLNHPATARDIQSFYDDNKEVFDQNPELHVGGYGKELNISGRLHISAQISDRKAAESLGRTLDQKSIWSNADRKEIPTGGTNQKTSFPNYSLEDRMNDIRGDTETGPAGFENLPKDLYDDMQPDERERFAGNKIKQQNLARSYRNITPSIPETSNAIDAGATNAGWWQRFIDAFGAIGDPATAHDLEILGPSHAEVLKQWHSAVSGNKNVADAANLAGHSYLDWLDAGKPKDRASINQIVRQNAAQPEGSLKHGNAAISDTIDAKGRIKSKGLDTSKLFSLINSPEMRGERPFGNDAFGNNPLAGVSDGSVKIPSMGATTAGSGNLNRLVLDAHMLDYYGAQGWTDTSYVAHSIHMRRAAEALGLKGGEGQEQLWGVVLGLKELLKSGLTPEEAAGNITDDFLMSRGKDYAEIIRNDPESNALFERMKSYGLKGPESTNAELDRIIGTKPAARSTTSVDTASLANSARRIRTTISASKIKSGPGGAAVKKTPSAEAEGWMSVIQANSTNAAERALSGNK